MKRLNLCEIVSLRLLLPVVLLGGLLPAVTWPAVAGEDPDPPPADAVSAGRLLTLEESVALALEKNFGIRQQRRNHLSAEQELKFAHAQRFYPRAWSEFLLPSYNKATIPQFDLETGIEVFVPSDSTIYDGSVNVALPVFTGGYFEFSYDAFRLDQTSGENEVHTWSSASRLTFNQPFLGDNEGKLAETRAETDLLIANEALRRQVAVLTHSVASAYYRLVRAIKREEIGRDRLEQARASYEIASNKFTAGLIPEVEAMQLEVEVARAEADQQSSIATRRGNQDQFRDILGLGLDEDVGVVTDVPLVGEEIDLQQAVQQALSTRSDIREQELQIELSRLNLRSVRRENNLQGNFSMYYGYDGKEESYSDTLDKWQPNEGLTFNLTLPIFDSGRNKSRVTQQRLSLEVLELGLEDLRRQVELEVRNAVRAVEETRSLVPIRASSLRVAERTYEINLQRFEVGTLTSQDLFQEEVRLNETRLEHLNAVIDLNLAWAEYERVVNQ